MHLWYVGQQYYNIKSTTYYDDLVFMDSKIRGSYFTVSTDN